MGYNTEKDVVYDVQKLSSNNSSEYVVQQEHVERRKSVSDEVTELSGIEATAASKAAWLIAITVSLGGKFDKYRSPDTWTNIS